MKLVSLKSDYAFKELFSHENVRKQFISDMLGIPVEQIKSAQIVNSHLWKRYRNQKQGILDVALELNDDTRMDIEMQVHPQKYWIKRNRNGNELTDLFELHILELRKQLHNTDNVDDWIRLFNARTQEDLDMITAKNVGFTEAIEVVKTMSLGKSLRYLYDQHMKAKRDRWAKDAWVRDQGRLDARRDDIQHWLTELGTIPDDLQEIILSETNDATLSSWSKAAAQATSIQDFRKRCQI